MEQNNQIQIHTHAILTFNNGLKEIKWGEKQLFN